MVAFTAFIVLGLPDGMLGTSWPFARAEFDRSVDQLAILISVGVAGYGLSSFFSGPIQARIGRGGSLAASFLVNIGAYLGIVLTPIWFGFVIAALLWGFGSGLMDPVVNGYVARHHGVRTMNLLHASFGVGATLGPVLLIQAMHLTGTWRGGFAVLVVLSAGMFLIVVRSRASWNAAGAEHGGSERPAAIDRGVVVLLMGFMASTGIEVAAGQWAFTIMTGGRNIAAGAAAGFVAAYWGGLTVGRLIGAVVGNPRGPVPTALVSNAVLIAGAAWFWLDPAASGEFGLPFMGMGVSLMFPGLVTATPQVSPRGTERVMGWGFAAAAAGAVAVPWLLGRVAREDGVAAITPYLLVAAVAAALLTLATAMRSASLDDVDVRS